MRFILFAAFISFISIGSYSQEPTNWTRDEINPGEDFTLTADESFFTEGTKSLHMRLHTGAVPYLVSDVFYITPGAEYEFSIDVFDNDTSGQVKVYADFYDTYGFNIFGQPPVFSVDSSQWQTISWSGTVPTQAVVGYILVKFYCQPDLYQFVKEADSWLDNVQFIQAGGTNLVANGGFEAWNVGIDESDGDQLFTVYPNPAKDYAMLHFDQNIQEIVINDLTGKIVYNLENSGQKQFQLDLTGWNNGLYLITAVQDGNKVFTKKFAVF
jgi:hypothetical protein